MEAQAATTQPVTVEQFTIDEEITCLNREIGKRKAVYPGMIQKGTMTQQEAEYQVAVMNSAMRRLKAIKYAFGNLNSPFV